MSYSDTGNGSSIIYNELVFIVYGAIIPKLFN